MIPRIKIKKTFCYEGILRYKDKLTPIYNTYIPNVYKSTDNEWEIVLNFEYQYKLHTNSQFVCA